MKVINIEQLHGYIRMAMKANPIPTPFVSDEIVPIDRNTIGICAKTIELENVQFISNFLAFDCNICGQNTVTGTTNYELNPVNSFRTKAFSSVKPYTALQKKYASEGRFNVLAEIPISQQEAWENMLEALILYGSPSEGIPGFLWGSGIPQQVDTNNFFNGSLTGTQMVSILTAYANIIGETNRYAYVAGTMIIPTNYATVLNNTNYNAQTSESVLDVLKTRLGSLPGGAVRLVVASSLEAAKSIIILPTDSEVIKIHATNLETIVDDREIASVANTAGVVAFIPTAGRVIRMSF